MDPLFPWSRIVDRSCALQKGSATQDCRLLSLIELSLYQLIEPLLARFGIMLGTCARSKLQQKYVGDKQVRAVQPVLFTEAQKVR